MGSKADAGRVTAPTDLRSLLSDREFEVASFVRDGYDNKYIAEMLGTAEQTIKNHLTSIFDKIGCDNRVVLAIRYERGERIKSESSEADSRSATPPTACQQARETLEPSIRADVPDSPTELLPDKRTRTVEQAGSKIGRTITRTPFSGNEPIPLPVEYESEGSVGATQDAPKGKWAEAMAEVLPCGHTQAQHFYVEAGDLKLEPCELSPSAQEMQANWEEGVREGIKSTIEARAAGSLSDTQTYPKPCGICDGVIQSESDLDWHGYGNCRDIPDVVMADLNIAQLLRDLQGHIAGELGERLDAAVTALANPTRGSLSDPWVAGWQAGRSYAANIADAWATSLSCEYHDSNPCCHVRTGAEIAMTIRKLPAPPSATSQEKEEK